MLNIINIFEVQGMPDSIEEQNAVVDKVFSTTAVHFHDQDTDKYYVVRITSVIDDDIKITKLDPSKDKERIDKIMGFLQQIDMEDNS